MFWERLVSLCAKAHVTPSFVCASLGLSNATATHWKKGAIPNATTTKKLADYFNVSVDYLLGKESPPPQPEPVILGAGGVTKETKAAVMEALNAEQALNEQIMQKKIALRDKIRDANLTMDQLIKIEYVISAIIDEK